MRILFYICFVLLIISCQSKEERTKNKILEQLQDRAISEEKGLRIDTLILISQEKISTFELVKEELNFFRRLKSAHKKIIDLCIEEKKIHLRGLNEINHIYPTPENKPRLDYIFKHINICDSTINANQPQFDEITAQINDILSNEYRKEYDRLEYYETNYYLRGQVNQKTLDDTVTVYISDDFESIVSFTNVLYVDEEN